MNLKQAVVFAVLMANGDGISSKAPSYILEKLDMCAMMTTPEQILDAPNHAIFTAWMDRWGHHGATP